VRRTSKRVSANARLIASRNLLLSLVVSCSPILATAPFGLVMPKKRHQPLYSKPRSTAPASLESSRREPSSSHGTPPNPALLPPAPLPLTFAPRGTHVSCLTLRTEPAESQGRSVNELLALPRPSPKSPGQARVPLPPGPSVPPALRAILQLPETPAPAPRRPTGVGPGGPAAPPSWLARSRHAPPAARRTAAPAADSGPPPTPLPGVYAPERGTLIDVVLRRLVLDWEFHQTYNQFHLPWLPAHLREAIISYLGRLRPDGVTLADLRLILFPPTVSAAADGAPAQDEEPPPSPSSLNEDMHHLDLSHSVGRSIQLKDVTHLLFPTPAAPASALQESWDSPSASAPPRPLLPNLTHLSLALSPGQAPGVTWKQLLGLAAHLPTLTHLSLAFWPAPSLSSPAARFAVVVSPHTGRSLPYGGTTPYSHSLDDDFAEAVAVLRRLGRLLVGLEFLDLAGAAAWAPALVRRAEHDEVDWAGDWGKVTELRLGPPDLAAVALGVVVSPARVERHIRKQRAGKGRDITVSGEGARAWLAT